jgi:hypothetical protein
MINMADGADVHVRFGSFEFILRHLRSPSLLLSLNCLRAKYFVWSGHGAHDRD